MGLWWKDKIFSVIPMKQSVINVKTVTDPDLIKCWMDTQCLQILRSSSSFFQISGDFALNLNKYFIFQMKICCLNCWQRVVKWSKFRIPTKTTNKQSQDWHWWRRWWQACSSRRRRRRPPPPPPTCSSASPSSRAATDRWEELLAPENFGKYIL